MRIKKNGGERGGKGRKGKGREGEMMVKHTAGSRG